MSGMSLVVAILIVFIYLIVKCRITKEVALDGRGNVTPSYPVPLPYGTLRWLSGCKIRTFSLNKQDTCLFFMICQPFDDDTQQE